MIKQHPEKIQIGCDEKGNIYINGVLRKGTISTNGYRQYGIKGKSFLGHRLIAECFLGRILKQSEVINHKDNVRTNNRIENLEIGTQESNIQHYWKHYGNIVSENVEVLNLYKAGEKHHNARLSMSQVCEMILAFYNGLTNKEASEKYKVHERYVSLIRHQKRWKKAWIKLGLEGSETIPSGSRVGSVGPLETETSLQLRDMI